MSYTSKTKNYELPQWQLSDTVAMTDFNDAFQSIDEKTVPNTRTINGKPLTDDIVIDAGAGGFLAANPVGSIYITTVATNPGTLYGGTWVSWGSGRMLVGVNTADSDFSSAEKTGGAKTHTLTTNEMPPHYHRTNTDYYYYVEKKDKSNVTGNSITSKTGGTWQGLGDVATSSAGGGAAHNNMPPYITCYMWKRTA